jgi:hypothetical protein
VKTVLSIMQTHFLTVYKFPKWAKLDIDIFCRSFLWHGGDPDKVKGGHTLLKRKVCNGPSKKVGRHGVTPYFSERIITLETIYFI